MEVKFNFLFFSVTVRRGRDDSYIVYKSSLHLPGPDKSPIFSAFDPKDISGFHFSKLPRMQGGDSGFPGPGYYDIPGTIGIVAPYAIVKSSVSIH